MLKNKIWANFQRIVEVFTQKFFQYALKYMGLGSGIPDPGVKKVPDPGSRIRIRNTGSYFWKVTVPVPVSAPYIRYTIKSKFFFKNLFPFYIVSCFTRKKINELRFRFRFHKAKSYGSYGSGSGYTTLPNSQSPATMDI